MARKSPRGLLGRMTTRVDDGKIPHIKSDFRCTRNRCKIIKLQRLRCILISTFRSLETADDLC